jgi:uncharacterized protein (DUF1778 family)
MAVKTATTNMQVDPRVKQLAQQAAKLERRSLSSFIEYMLYTTCPTIIANKSRETLKATHNHEV